MKGKLEFLEGKNTWVVIGDNGIEVWPLHPEDIPPFIHIMQESIFDDTVVEFDVVEFEINGNPYDVDYVAKLKQPFYETWDHILRDHKDGFVRLPTGNYTSLAEFMRNNFYPPRRIDSKIK